jgi:20S proteasome alpha/beta subunit
MPVDFAKPKPYPPDKTRGRHRAMTVGIGLIRNDGIVVASDAQYTSSTQKRRGQKIFVVGEPDGVMLCITGAADPGIYVRYVAERLGEGLPASLNSVRALLDHVEKAISGVYKKHIHPYRGPKDDRPRFDLLIAAWDPHIGLHLVETVGTLAEEVQTQDYRSVGTGSDLANYIIDTLGPQGGTVEDAKYLAICAVNAANNFDPNCGKGIALSTMYPDGRVEPMHDQDIANAESYFKDLWDSVGLLLVGMNPGIDTPTVDALLGTFRDGILRFREKHDRLPGA